MSEAEQSGTDRSAAPRRPAERSRAARSPRALAAWWPRARRGCAGHPRLARFGVALAVYAAYELVLCWLGLPMVLYWGKMQLLDRSWLLDHPFECLLYLHSQTPLLNTLAMFIAHASALTGLAEAAIASALFGLLAFGCFALLLEVAQLATGSRLASAICGAALLANPAFAFYRHRLLYEIPAMLAVLLVTWGFLCFVREGRGRDWIGLIVALALLCVTKSLFHPLLALAIALLALAARHFSARTPLRDLARRCAPGFALGIALVVLWPAKNALVFGQFVSSSWLGFNLIVRTPVEPYEPFVDFIERAQIHASLEPQIARFEPLFAGDDLEVVLALKKPSHPKIPNWNHLAVLYTSGELVRRGLAWRFANFGEWMRMTAGRYFMTMRASFVFPYSAKRLFRASKRFNAYAKRYRDFIHPDLRPWLERAFPNWFVHRYAVIIDAPIPYTPWAFAYPPLLLAFALVALRRRREPLGGFLALCALASAWTILVPALTDGAEGNRMRLATAPLVSVGAYALAQLATRWLRGRRRA